MDRGEHSILSPGRIEYLLRRIEESKNPPTASERTDRNLKETRKILDELHKSPIFKGLHEDSKEA